MRPGCQHGVQERVPPAPDQSGGAEKYAQKTVTVDGHKLCPIVKYYAVDDESAVNSRQKILF